MSHQYNPLLNKRVEIHRVYQKLRSIIKLNDAFIKKSSDSIDLTEETQSYNSGIVFAGLRKFNAKSTKDAFFIILNALSSLQILAFPGFTPSFRNSGIYSVQYSRPEIGALSLLAYDAGMRRTLDPIHSLFIDQDQINLSTVENDTFHPDGVYKNFVQPGSCWINIGTHTLISSLFHYIERYAAVPYLEPRSHEGVILLNNGQIIKVNHSSYSYNQKIVWNRKKIEKYLIRNGCLRFGVWYGVICRVINGHKAMELLVHQIRKDPFFLVTL